MLTMAAAPSGGVRNPLRIVALPQSDCPQQSPWRAIMFVTVTGKYNSVDKVKNAENELQAIGIPSEKIFVDMDAMQIKVMIPEATKPEIMELLGRHEPSELS